MFIMPALFLLSALALSSPTNAQVLILDNTGASDTFYNYKEGTDDKSQKFNDSNSKKIKPLVLAGQELTAVNSFVAEINRSLPPQVIAALNSNKIELAFATIKSGTKSIARQDFEPGPSENRCLYPDDEASAKNISDRIERANLSILASTKARMLLRPQRGDAVILLDSAWLPHILKADKNSTDFECFHRNFYRAAQGEVFRNIARVFDSHSKISTSEQYKHMASFTTPNWFMKNVLFRGSKSKSRLKIRTPDAREFLSPSHHFWINAEYFLADPEYQCRRPGQYNYFGIKLGKANGVLSQNPSQDIFHPFSPNLSRGVNVNCQINTELPIVTTGTITNDSGTRVQEKWIEMTDLSPNFVYDVDSNLAGSGEGIMSGFGHSMARFNVCGTVPVTIEQIKSLPEIYDSAGRLLHNPRLPDSKITDSALIEHQIGTEDISGNFQLDGRYNLLTMNKYYDQLGNLIPLDRLPEILRCQRTSEANKSAPRKARNRTAILNYRANVTDLMINNIKGLRGGENGYISQAFMYSEPAVRQEYNIDELRDLYFIPIQFSPNMKSETLHEFNKDTFVYNTLSRYWAYYGTYSFIFNNCAGEQWDLIQSSLPFESTEIHKKEALTPRGVEKKMNALGLLDNKVAQQLEVVRALTKRFKKSKAPLAVHSLMFPKLEESIGATISQNEYDTAFDVAGMYNYIYPSNVGYLQWVLDALIDSGSTGPSVGPFAQAVKEIIGTDVNKISAHQFVDDASEDGDKEKSSGVVTATQRYKIAVRTMELMDEKQIPDRVFNVNLSRLATLENQIVAKNKKTAFKAIFKYVQDTRDSIEKLKRNNRTSEALAKEQSLSAVGEDIMSALRDFDNLKFEMMPWRYIKSGYGIPLKDEVKITTGRLGYTDAIERANQKLDEVMETFITWGQKNKDIDLSELQELSRSVTLRDYLDATRTNTPINEKVLIDTFGAI